MSISLFIWLVLMIIGVSDAKAHRIPNKSVILLLMLLCLNTLIQTPNEALWSMFLDNSVGLVIALVFALALHLLRVMAPGDVKLIAVLGFFLGTAELLNYFYYVCLITVFVGPMYWLLNRLYLVPTAKTNMEIKGQSSLMSFTGMAVTMQVSQQALKKKITTGKDLTYMPFAPILVLGLALHQYYT